MMREALHSISASDTMEEMRTMTTTAPILPIDDNEKDSHATIIGILVFAAILLLIILITACHAICTYCFGMHHVCKTGEEIEENNSERPAYPEKNVVVENEHEC